MQGYRQLFLRFCANIDSYLLTLSDGKTNFRLPVYDRKACVRVCTRSPRLQIIATPLTNGYSTRLYFHVDTACKTVFRLYFQFPQDAPSPTPPAPPTARNAFTLTDANYGMPIDGTLLFTQLS